MVLLYWPPSANQADERKSDIEKAEVVTPTAVTERVTPPRTTVPPPPDVPAPKGSMLNILDEEDRAMLILKYAENYNYEELSEIFGLSVSACKMRISRACDKIQARFGEQL